MRAGLRIYNRVFRFFNSFLIMKRYGKRRSGKRPAAGRRYRRRYVRRLSKRTSVVAKKALRLATRLASHTEETKCFRRGVTADIINNGAGDGFAIWENVSAILNTDVILFNGDGGLPQFIHGNKYYHKRSLVRWEIHLDNTNNEEETVNFTVALLSFKRDADNTIATTNYKSAMGKFTDRFQGQAFFDPRFVKIHKYKHFTLTMGGTSPGTSGQMLKRGCFTINRNKMVRRANALADNGAYPTDFQELLFFVVLTDNVSTDLENPRINYTVVNTIKDTDLRNTAQAL